MSISLNIENISKQLPDGVKLIAVSKTHPVETILEAYNAGQKVFGENRVQELVAKYEALPKDIEWHLIGHLQSNKVKFIAPFVSLIHSVDSLALLKEINKYAAQSNRVLDCLLQVFIAKEETKFGLDEDELYGICNSHHVAEMKNIRVRGLMGMATNTNNETVVRSEFRYLKNLFGRVKLKFFAEQQFFSEISMGMTSDWKIAVEEGSTMVRIGSAIFGQR
ncbi:MAG: YggS family pyridoxal phosphate-dependent enzyme [Flavobacteriales bacterium]|nr:YggS family pyridoxal phosphate-dependent enzyme [Flavobacteriales bacterium]